MKFNHTKIEETAEELQSLMVGITSDYHLQKLRALYFLKTRKVKTVTNLAMMVGVNRITVHRWLNKYKKGGLKMLLNNRHPSGRRRKIPPEVLQALIGRLDRKNSGFKTYCDVQTWLQEKYGLEVSYNVVYSTIRYQLNLSIRGTYGE
jgi:putative transposase